MVVKKEVNGVNKISYKAGASCKKLANFFGEDEDDCCCGCGNEN